MIVFPPGRNVTQRRSLIIKAAKLLGPFGIEGRGFGSDLCGSRRP